MSDTEQGSESIDPAETLRQISGLAEHLSRMGAAWLPPPDPDRVKELGSEFARPARQAAQAAAEKTTAPPATSSQRAERSATAEAGPSTSPSKLFGDDSNAGKPYPGSPQSAEARSRALQVLSEQVAACTRCDQLARCRTNTVFGEGNVAPRVVFFGEGPGRDEDISGRPFVGKAGQLLTKMIEACTFAREDVYIMNTVKCRPPNNRNPEPTEIENCREYFEKQLELLRPEYIVCLGLVSAQTLLRTKLSVGRLRGKFHRHFDSKVVVTYHPSYLLRTPAAKKAAWDDLQMMLRDAGLQ